MLDTNLDGKRATPETDELARGNHVVPTEWAEDLERERDEARAESLEQAQLLGKGSEREARLITERDHYKQALEAIKALADKKLLNTN